MNQTTVTMSRPLAGKVALITGAGRPRGIGRAIALHLARAGADLIVSDLGQSRSDLNLEGIGLGDSIGDLEETAELARDFGVNALAMQCDITQSEQIDAVLSTAASRKGCLDILVNNAGTGIGAGAFESIDERSWRLSWEVNVHGTVSMCRAAMPYLACNGGGTIINVVSTLGVAAQAGYGAYVLAKHALVGLTRLLAVELGPRGIRVNAVAPGMIHTDMGAHEMEMIAAARHISVDEANAAVISEIPLARLGTADDVASAIAWLASPLASYVNGVILPVHGGIAAGLN